MSTLLASTAPVVHLVFAGLLLAGETTLATATPPPADRVAVDRAAADRAAAAASPDRLRPADGVWPLAPRPDVVTDFDPPASPYAAGHRGVDLAGEPGQRVRAAVGGRVTYAGNLAGRGVVVVAHGATRTTYEPVAATVEVGQVVEAGAVLGRLESGRGHCAPEVCLHWGLIEGETYLDPLTLVGAGPVRLLPLSGR